jgi:tRNA(adenine34) deaminase
MFAALQEAEYALQEDEIPIGAVVVHNEKIIGRGRNQVEKLNDSTAHAEILAITAASNHLQSKFLSGCDIYVTAEPCMMCSGAILLARLRSVFFSVFEPKFGAAGSLYNLLEEDRYNHTVKVFSGIYENESRILLEKFFKSKRQKK